MVTEIIRFRYDVEKSDYQALRKVSTDWPFSESRVVAISLGIFDSSLKFTPTADLNLERELLEMIRRAHADALAATKISENPLIYGDLFFIIILTRLLGQKPE